MSKPVIVPKSLKINILGTHRYIIDSIKIRRTHFGQSSEQPRGYCFGIMLQWLEHTFAGKETRCLDYFKKNRDRIFSFGVASHLQRIHGNVSYSMLVNMLNSRRGISEKYKEISKNDLYNMVNNISVRNVFKKKPKAFIIYLKTKSGERVGHVVALVNDLDKILVFDANCGIFEFEKKSSLKYILDDTIFQMYLDNKWQDYEVGGRHIMVK